MNIHLYAFCWNEEKMLPFFFRHYDPIITRYFITDDGSDDKTLQMLKKHPKVTLLEGTVSTDAREKVRLGSANQRWKSSKDADWVLCCDIDELFYHPKTEHYLRKCREQGITFIHSKGYQMITENFPAHNANLAFDHRLGVPLQDFDKPCFFNPQAIEETGFIPGLHRAHPKGRVCFNKTAEIQLLHYKFLGKDYLLKRHERLNQRLLEGDRKNGWGFHYDHTFTLAEYARILENKKDIPLQTKCLPPEPTEEIPASWAPRPKPPFFQRKKKQIKRFIEKYGNVFHRL